MIFSTETLVTVAQQILIYGGVTMILIGMFGSLMIILIFIQRPLNQNPCSTYIIANAVLSFLFLPFYYLPNIVTFGFQINWFASSTVYCKLQPSYGAFTITSIFVLNCFILLDRYAISSRSVRIRSLSTKRNARIVVVTGLFLVCCVIGVPVMVLFESIPVPAIGLYYCGSRNNAFVLFLVVVFVPIVEGVLPIVLALYFWLITQKHMVNINNRAFVRRFDKQITKMLLFQIIANAIGSFPYAVLELYGVLTSEVVRTQDQANIVQFFYVITIWLFNTQYCSDFYIYVITSRKLRVQARRLICFSYQRRANRVALVPVRTLLVT